VAQPDTNAVAATAAAINRIENIFNMGAGYRRNGPFAFGSLREIGGSLRNLPPKKRNLPGAGEFIVWHTSAMLADQPLENR